MVQSSLRWIMENLGENQNASQMPNRLAFVTEKWKSIRKCWKASFVRFLYPVGGNLMHLNTVETLLCLSDFFYLLLSDVDYSGGENCVIIFFICFFSQAVTRFSPWWPTSSYCINNLPITLHTVLFCKICFFFFLPFFFKGRKNLKTQEHERAGIMLVLLWQDKMEYKTVLASIMWLHIQSSSLYINYVRPVFWGKAEAHRGRGNPRYWFSARCAIPSCLDTSVEG